MRCTQQNYNIAPYTWCGFVSNRRLAKVLRTLFGKFEIRFIVYQRR
jgi:hypothetical protein